MEAGAGFGTRLMLQEAAVLGYDPKSDEMKAFTSRLRAYGASSEFCDRIYSHGVMADLETSTTAQGVAIPRLHQATKKTNNARLTGGAGSHTRSSIERGYATARARALNDGSGFGGLAAGRKTPSRRNNLGGPASPFVERTTSAGSGRSPRSHGRGGSTSGQLWDDPDVVGFDDPDYPARETRRARGGSRPMSPLSLAAERAAAAVYGAGGDGATAATPGAGPSGGRQVLSEYKRQAMRADAADSWYARHRSNDKASVKGQVEADIQNMLLSSREIAGRLRPPPVARKATIDFLSTPKMPRGVLDNYDGTDPVEWSRWKKEEMARAEQAAESKKERLQRWTQKQREQMKRWKGDKDALDSAMQEHAEALEKEKKRYARELGKYIKSKNAEEVGDYKARRERMTRLAAEMKGKKLGDFSGYSNGFRGPLLEADKFGKVSHLDILPDIHAHRNRGVEPEPGPEPEAKPLELAGSDGIADAAQEEATEGANGEQPGDEGGLEDETSL